MATRFHGRQRWSNCLPKLQFLPTNYDRDKKLVQCDPSRLGLVSALIQEGWPLAYARRVLRRLETHYATTEKEMLAKWHQSTTASHQCGSGSISRLGVICGSVEFVVGSRLCSERFFSGYSGFPLSSKTNISKFQFHLDYCQALYHEPLAREIAQALPVLWTLNVFL